MTKEKIILPVGDNKALVYEATPGHAQEQEFARQCKTVAATRPGEHTGFFCTAGDPAKAQVAKKEAKWPTPAVNFSRLKE